ncbi:hypothetical protein CROQUDRAFT_680869 [Cronartium quercuum f. sp. fusiforme G11]|uniref:Thioredoxin domain-containing protein n=1 Tax=Cronartium quercuum f. sp. fusiforme G11 TaxID=708437 RepID=A0A9P6TF83_9BASI|nr:hypothetical protein CROQUDRAFT_680869 [Cronartium quercuum f. sp. fusiforme G11]
MILLPQQSSFSLNDYDLFIRYVDSRAQAQTLVFWSDRESETGQMWCPDCVQMEATLIDLMASSPTKAWENLIYVYVGQREEWRSSTNKFRSEPWNVDRIPTVLKVAPKAQGLESLKDRVGSISLSRIVEEDANDKEQLAKYLVN